MCWVRLLRQGKHTVPYLEFPLIERKGTMGHWGLGVVTGEARPGEEIGKDKVVRWDCSS